MKKITVFSIIILLSLNIFIGCSNDSEPSITYTGGVLEQGIVGEEYSESIETAFGVSGITYELALDSTLPDGLDLVDGKVEGTPTTVTNEVHTFSVTASAAGVNSVTAVWTITIIEPPNSMTFVDNLDNIGREFIIYDNLRFRVEIFDEYFEQFDEDDIETLAGIGIIPGLIVTGRVQDTNDTWISPTIAGKARNMDANVPFVAGIFSHPDMTVDIELTYTTNNGEISGVNVEFPGEESFVGMAVLLMGGPYIRKE